MATIYGLGSKRDARHPTSHIVQQRTFDFDDEVVVMSFGQWVEVCDDFGTTPTYFPWHLRQADICLNGLWIRSGDIGRKLQSGNAVFEAIEAVTPNAKLDSIRVGLADVLSVDMRAGVLCRVIQSGEVVLGQSAVFV